MPRVYQGANADVGIVESSNRAQVDAPGDALAEPTFALDALGLLHVFNGATWDRVRAGGSASPLQGTLATTRVDNPINQSDTDLNNSSKVITVPANRQWWVNSITVDLTTTATVGNRRIGLIVRDTADRAVYNVHVGVVQAASLSRSYTFMPGVAREVAFVSTMLLCPIPPDLVIPAGWDLLINDTAAIDAAADDMIIDMLVQEKVIP